MGYRIGLILGTKSADYPRMVRLGVQNTLEHSGHTLVCLADLVPYYSHEHGPRYLRVIFALARRLDLDAIIVPAGTTSGYLKNDVALTQELLHLLDPEKAILLERDIPGYRCIGKDNRAAMAPCIRYLIEERGYRRIAFVSGSADSRGAREREAAYFDEMTAHGLKVPDGFFVRGDFSGECDDVIGRLVDEHPDVEAIACATDQIAFAAYRALRKRRIVIGHDIAVTGFDGHQDAEHLDPPLTTVAMTGYELGCMGAREAIRLCEGLPQKETTQTGSFVPRESCGARRADEQAYLVELMSREPFPIDEIVDHLMGSCLSMAGDTLTKRFRASVETLAKETGELIMQRFAHPEADVLLFSSLSLAELLSRDYQGFFSLEGFHTAVLSHLRALASIHPEQATWLTEQASSLHLRVARILDARIKEEMARSHLREWRTLHLTEDALAEDARPQEAYRLMLADLDQIGMRWAELFLLPNAEGASLTPSEALSDTLWHVGTLRAGEAQADETSPVALQKLVGYVLGRHEDTQVCSIGAILADEELMGILAMDGGSLDDNGQLMAMLNIGLALKHLQNMASIRDMNDILNANNLVLARQSQHDELTGLLNRRSLHERALIALREHVGQLGALLYLDLDGLKYINDTFGHDAGDAAIRMTAHVVKGSLPADALFARMGGDEFVAFELVPDEATAEGIVSAIKQGLAQANAARDPLAVPYELAMSIGLLCFEISDDGEADLANALMKADERMYEAKQRHRQRSSYRGRESVS